MRFVIVFIMCFFITKDLWAHEMTPTYPELRKSFIEGVYVTTLTIFNRRSDVQYYEISVFDGMWKPLAFAAESKLIKLEYLDRKIFDVYIRDDDSKKVKYICTKSKILKGENINSVISSRICSKIK